MKSKWSDSLSKSSISDFLIEDVLNENASGLPDEIIGALKTVVESKKDLKSIKEAIAYLKPLVSKDVFTDISDEFKEIKSDLKWLGSDRGKYTAALNDWLQLFHSEFNSMGEFEKVMIGGHAEKMVVFVTGEVQDQKDFDALLEYVNQKNPPFKLFTKVRIRNA